jgi:hypothetical protein
MAQSGMDKHFQRVKIIEEIFFYDAMMLTRTAKSGVFIARNRLAADLSRAASMKKRGSHA